MNCCITEMIQIQRFILSFYYRDMQKKLQWRLLLFTIPLAGDF